MSRVSIVKCDNYENKNLIQALETTFDNLGGISRFIKPGMKVVIKPNLVMKKNPKDAATTHPALVSAVCSLVVKAGASAIIAESPGGLYTEGSLKAVYSVCGMDKAALESGAVLNHDVSEVEIQNPDAKYVRRLNVIKPLTEADLIINLPKLKTHGQMIYTGAVKNMFGAIPGLQKPEYHMRMSNYEDFANALIDIYLSVKPGLNIMDAVTGMEGSGPTAGNPRHIGIIAASENAFELDMTMLDILKVDPGYVFVTKCAISRGLCPANIKEIDIVGEKSENVRVEKFDMPQLDTLANIQFFNNRMLRALFTSLKPKPVFRHAACVGCSECAKSCPAHIIEMKNKKPYADLSKCIRCFCCQELCPAKAVVIKKPLISRIIFGKPHK
ncbi:MAG: DUF362 domain-containing protein [Bacillota bacterium]|nr:DUF362 domain-containing protein [Bacillota bacterium]